MAKHMPIYKCECVCHIYTLLVEIYKNKIITMENKIKNHNF